MRKKSRKRRGARLGQHFLVNPAAARAVADAAHIKEGDAVLEIGPGKGMLTRELLRCGARVVAIEKDPAMIAALRETLGKELAS